MREKKEGINSKTLAMIQVTASFLKGDRYMLRNFLPKFILGFHQSCDRN